MHTPGYIGINKKKPYLNKGIEMQTKIAPAEYIEVNLKNIYSISAQKWHSAKIDPMVRPISYLVAFIVTVATTISVMNVFLREGTLWLIPVFIIGAILLFTVVSNGIKIFASKYHSIMLAKQEADLKVILASLAKQGWTLQNDSEDYRGTMEYFLKNRQARFFNACGIKYTLSQISFSKYAMTFQFILVDEKTIADIADNKKHSLAEHRLLQWELNNGLFATEAEKEAFKKGILAY